MLLLVLVLAVTAMVAAFVRHRPASLGRRRLSMTSENGGPPKSGFRYQQPETKALAYGEAAALDVKMPVIILVSPFLDKNVGSVSRAMLNFGLHELRVVDPRCDILSDDARALASGSVEILENAKVFATCEECLADLQRVFATTVRPRRT